MDDQSQARFRHALQTLSKPRDAEGVDCLPPMPPAVATATPDGNDGLFIAFLSKHPKAMLYLTCPQSLGGKVLRIVAEADGRRADIAVDLRDRQRDGGFIAIEAFLEAVERQLFKDKPDA